MTKANDRQVAGDHYKSSYQHWDWVVETNQGYLMGCATKYVARHRKKNGVQDLEKAMHFLQKINEHVESFGLEPRAMPEVIRLTEHFILKNDINDEDATILLLIVGCDITTAIGKINVLIPKH